MAPDAPFSRTVVTHPSIVILTESPPLDPSRLATGLSVRHTRMAQSWASQGLDVHYAWPQNSGLFEPSDADQFCAVPLHDAEQFEAWTKAHPRAIIVLGYWELANYLPAAIDGVLILDHVAPRLLERQFEQPTQLSHDLQRLVPLLSRCDQVWVGNRQQIRLMTSLLRMAGVASKPEAFVRVVPISAPVAHSARRPADVNPLRIFHGGRDWPWRNSQPWIQALQDAQLAEVELIDAAGPGRWDSFSDYLAAYETIHLALECSEDNIERRHSQSFRATDALCQGVPVVVNRFLPIADWVDQHGAGWLLDEPAQLPELMQHLIQHPDALRKASEGAIQLASLHLDVSRHYALMPEQMMALAAQPPTLPRQPVAPFDSPETAVDMNAARPGPVKRGIHRWIDRRLRDRPRPTAEQSAWVVVSRADVFPTNHGAAVKIERTAWALSFHVDRVLLLTDNRFHFWEYRDGVRTQRPFPFWMRIPGWPSRVNLLRLIARGLPYSNAFLYLPLVDRGLHMRLAWLFSRYPVAVVQGDFPAYAHPAIWASMQFGARSLLVEHNVEFLRIREQVPDLSDSAARWLEHQEVGLANGCQQVVTVSDRDRSLLIEAGVQADKIRTIPHGVDLDAFQQASAVDVHALYDIDVNHRILVYHGIFNYPPNLQAVQELSSSLLPQLKQAGIAATVLAIGPRPPSSSLPGVVFTGPIDPLAGHLKAGDLAVIPLRDGGGTRMKILDDFAAGVPVVTTAKGMEGIPVRHGEHLWIEDDPHAMAEAVIQLLNDRPMRDSLAEEALDWVSLFDWKAIAARYVELVGLPVRAGAADRRSCES